MTTVNALKDLYNSLPPEVQWALVAGGILLSARLIVWAMISLSIEADDEADDDDEDFL